MVFCNVLLFKVEHYYLGGFLAHVDVWGPWDMIDSRKGNIVVLQFANLGKNMLTSNGDFVLDLRLPTPTTCRIEFEHVLCHMSDLIVSRDIGIFLGLISWCISVL